MGCVIVLKSALLPYSETFIREQAVHCATWHPVLVGTHRVDGTCMDGLDARLLSFASDHPVVQRLRQVLRELHLFWPYDLHLLRRERADLVHVHFATELVAHWPLLRALGLPVLTTLHGADVTISAQARARGGVASRKYPARLAAIAKHPLVHFLAVSEPIRLRAAQLGIPKERIVVRHIGVSCERFRPGPTPLAARRRKIVFVGRLVEKKGCRYLLEAFARVHGAGVEGELVVLGDGPLRQSLAQQAASLRIPVTFAGACSHDEVRAHLESARLFCLPSITAENGDTEGLPISILEAQACGLPVITSASGGTGEGMLHGQTGFAFAERDVPALARYLQQLLADDDLAEEMGAAAARFVRQRFDIRACTRKLEEEYARVSRDGRRRARASGEGAETARPLPSK